MSVSSEGDPSGQPAYPSSEREELEVELIRKLRALRLLRLPFLTYCFPPQARS